MAAGAKRGGKPVPLSYRANVAARLIAGIVGGYVVTALAAMLLARSLPLSRVDATEAAIMASFIIYVCLLMAVFAIHHLWIVLASFSTAGLVLAGALWLTGGVPFP